MATQVYRNWLAAGEPYRLAEWMNDLVETMRGRGYTVYHYPDVDHLTTDQPQDHTPFSYTGWPIDSPFGWGFGVDIMPKNGDARSLTPLARQIIADKDASHPALSGLKYINWTDESGQVWQTSWKPTKATRPNTDKGHLHLSGRSDSAHWRAVDYDPIARMNGEDDMGYADAFLELGGGSSGPAVPAEYRAKPATVAGNSGREQLWAIRGELAKVLAGQTAEAARDQAVLAGITALANAGGVDAAPIVAAIEAVRSQVLAEITELQAEVTKLQAEVNELQDENDALKAQISAVPPAVVAGLVAELTD